MLACAIMLYALTFPPNKPKLRMHVREIEATFQETADSESANIFARMIQPVHT